MKNVMTAKPIIHDEEVQTARQELVDGAARGVGFATRFRAHTERGAMLRATTCGEPSRRAWPGCQIEFHGRSGDRFWLKAGTVMYWAPVADFDEVWAWPEWFS